MADVISEMVQVHVYRQMPDGRVEFLMLQRSSDEEIYPDLWQPVTGSIEPGETAATAARRETIEETGMSPLSLLVVPYVASFFSPRRDAVHLVPVFAAQVSHRDEVQLSDEHQACEWLGHADAFERSVFPGHREGLRVLMDYVLAPLTIPVVVPA